MAIAIKDNTVIAVEIEDTEGTYKAPAADTSYVQVLSDGVEMSPAKELLERNIFTGSIGKITPRTSTRSVTASMPTELRGGDSEAEAPEYDALLRSALGSKRTALSKTADDTDAGGPHTASRIYLLDADAGNFKVGDIVTVKVAGAHHTSPITAISDVAGDVYIDLLVAKASGTFTDGDVITAVTTYTVADNGHPSLSITKYIEDAIAEKAIGCKVTSMSLDNFTTGQLASLNFSVEGLTFEREITANPFTPNFKDALPPIILEACVYQDGVQIDVNNVSINLENTLGFVTSTCSTNGRISSRATSRTITGSFNPYKQDDSIAQFNKFNDNTEYSVFLTAHLPTGVAGEYERAISIYLPKCITTEISEADQDGLLQEELSFSATQGPDGASNEMYISFN